MPILIVLSAAVLLSLTKPFRGLAFGLLLLAAAVCFGIAMILWRLWMDCKHAISFALGRDNVYREEEATQRFHATFHPVSQSLGEPIPLRLPAPRHGKGSRGDRAD